VVSGEWWVLRGDASQRRGQSLAAGSRWFAGYLELNWRLNQGWGWGMRSSRALRPSLRRDCQSCCRDTWGVRACEGIDWIAAALPKQSWAPCRSPSTNHTREIAQSTQCDPSPRAFAGAKTPALIGPHALQSTDTRRNESAHGRR
jgi:hypothetical protein